MIHFPVLRSNTPRFRALLAGTIVALAASGAQAQFTYDGCTDLQPNDFQSTELFSRNSVGGSTASPDLAEPVAMDFNPVVSGDSVIGADVYFVQREGSFRKYDYVAKTVKQIGFVDNAEAVENGSGDNGLMGIALDPGFASNRHVYLWYVPPRVGNNNYRGRLSRFTLGEQDTLLLESEKNLIDIQLSKTRQWHAGGPMRFDAHGDLWVTIGNNGSDLSGNGSQYSTTDSNQSQEWGASSTASMRGGVIRIHPDTSEKGYSIPAGNFGDYWADYFEENGNPTLAADYRNPAKVLPEVYVKGTRSNFSIWVHPTKRWLGWGEVNYQGNNDEYNLVTTPSFTGFPYFHRQNVVTPGSGSLSPAKDPAAPTNTSPLNLGATTLPPAEPSVLWFASGAPTDTTLSTNVAIGGDMYLYDGNLKSSAKFPPHFNHQWLLMSETSSTMFAVSVDETTADLTSAPVRVDDGVLGLPDADASNAGSLRKPIQASFGPDGALYVLNYGGNDYSTNMNPGLFRVAYTGSCLPVGIAHDDYRLNPDGLAVQMRRDGLFIREAGHHTVALRTLTGKQVAVRTGHGSRQYSFAALRDGARLEPGVYIVSVTTASGRFVRQVTLL